MNSIISQMESEIWISISEYEGSYEISSFGNVRSLERLSSSGAKIKGRLLKPGRHPYGYSKFALSKDGKVKDFSAHRLVAAHFIENPFKYPMVNHLDSNPKNNHVSNLEWCTSSQNTIHAYRSGRMGDNSGINNGMAKYSPEFILSIVELRKTKTLKDISTNLNISIGMVADVCYGRRWSKLTGIVRSPKGTKSGPTRKSCKAYPFNA